MSGSETMLRTIPMPEVSPGLEAATLRKWMVRPGDLVEDGDLLAEIETDKAVLELEAPEAGRIADLLVTEGARDVPVGSAIATLAEGAADGAASAAATEAAPGGQPAPAQPGAASVREGHTVREALRAALAREMARDDTVVLIGENVASGQGAYRVSHGLAERFGAARVVDVPPLFQGVAGLAIGAAMAGLRPVVEVSNMAFALQAMGQIVQSAAKTAAMTGGALSVPVVFRGPHGAVEQMGGQLSHDMAAAFAQVPGLKVVAPYDAADAAGLLTAAIRDPGPVIVLESDALYGQSFPDAGAADEVPLGQARILRAGADVTLASYGAGLVPTLEAAARLAVEGIGAEVIDLRSLAPLDTELVADSLRKTHRCVVVEMGWTRGGIGQQLSAALMRDAFDALDAPVLCLGAADVARPYAEGLEAAALPDADGILRAAKAVLYR